MGDTGLRFIDPPAPDERVIAYEIVGRVTVEDMHAVVERIERLVAAGRKARIYQDVQATGGVDMAAIGEKLKHVKTLWKGMERAAVIGDSRLLDAYVRLIAPFSPIEIKSFAPSETDQAWAWLVR